MLPLGVDSARNAVSAAQGRAQQRGNTAEFACLDIGEVEGTFDVIYAANFYQVLDAYERSRFRRIMYGLLRPRGWFFLMTLSTNDPEEYGRGQQVPDEENTFRTDHLRHFCTEEELRQDFSTFEMHDLREKAYDEPHLNGPTHHHIAWFLMARKQ
jgi:cyclopropane fatty-acyl-phospholipid synthase-like methyltransferase